MQLHDAVEWIVKDWIEAHPNFVLLQDTCERLYSICDMMDEIYLARDGREISAEIIDNGSLVFTLDCADLVFKQGCSDPVPRTIKDADEFSFQAVDGETIRLTVLYRDIFGREGCD